MGIDAPDLLLYFCLPKQYHIALKLHIPQISNETNRVSENQSFRKNTQKQVSCRSTILCEYSAFDNKKYLHRKNNWYLEQKVKYTLIFLLFSLLTSYLSAQQSQSVSGTILEKASNNPVQYVAVGLKELNRWQYSNNNGKFTFQNIPAGKYTLVAHCLGYTPFETTIDLQTNWTQTIILQRLDLRIQEVIVTATEKANEPGTSVINRQAMQHLQPSGFGDLLELLPGYRWEKQNLSEINSIKLRQAGDDLNTAYGTSFYVDGMPLSSDASMQGNNLAESGLKLKNRINVANGIDMRQVPTDDIEQVEIVRGIPSARQGNLSTGAVIIKRKWGESPLSARAKTDLKNKVFAISKGINMGKHTGILNLGTELLHYKDDPRSPLQTYLRNQSSLRYSNHYSLGQSTLSVKTGLDYLLTIDKDKEDPELNYGMKDEYRTERSQMDFSVQSDLHIPGDVSKNLEFRIKASHTQNTLTRDRLVALIGPQPIPASMKEGKYYAEYLPSRYEASFERDDQPFQLFASLDFSLTGKERNLTHQFNSGVDWQTLKNFGKGDIFDASRPLFPTNGGRPYDFSAIPAMHTLSFYAEEELNLNMGEHHLKVRPGIRIQMLPGISKDFDMQGKVYTDLRGHIGYTLPKFQVAGQQIKLTLHAAMGEMTRMPALAMLYPQQEYFDIVELNYYSRTPELRQLYVMTEIEDRTNYNIRPVRNLKKEIGLNAKIGKTKVMLSLFDEYLNDGILSAANFVSYTYNYYDPASVSSENLTAPPAIDLFSAEERSRLFSYRQYVNSSELHKKGLEYQIISPKIRTLNTRITLNGAWFKTRYHISQPEYEKHYFVYQGIEYPYVGIFAMDDSESEKKELFNTNLRFDTHLPQHRLLLTLALQTTWYEKEQYLPYDGTPVAYMDNKGNIYPYTVADQEDPLLKLLTRTFTPYHFDEQKKPIDMGVNIKVSKEIGDHLTFAFFVNRLINYLPDYKLRTGATYIRSEQPYFGMELKFNI